MSAESSGVFTLKEINRVKIIQDVIERRITTRRAAEHLGISDRQCRRLLARYRDGGPLGMASKRCGKRGNRQLPPGLTDQALELIRTRYADFGPTLAREKLEELHGLFLGKETVRRIMVRAGLWIPRKQRAARIPQPRYRRPRFLISRPRGTILIGMVNRWHCTAIKSVFFVLIINTPQAETGILSLGELCMN
ncbi:hypothetical protein SPARK1531C2_04925 [Klebsiella grimontii]|nr:hypothetical protein SPARK1531C2_04925 [Klebsiella grimontii]